MGLFCFVWWFPTVVNMQTVSLQVLLHLFMGWWQCHIKFPFCSPLPLLSHFPLLSINSILVFALNNYLLSKLKISKYVIYKYVDPNILFLLLHWPALWPFCVHPDSCWFLFLQTQWPPLALRMRLAGGGLRQPWLARKYLICLHVFKKIFLLVISVSLFWVDGHFSSSVSRHSASSSPISHHF